MYIDYNNLRFFQPAQKATCFASLFDGKNSYDPYLSFVVELPDRF